MEVKVKTNPSSSQNPSTLKNTQQNEAEKLLQLLQNKKISLAELEKILQQQEQNQSDEFIVKSTVKASYVALRTEQLLILKKKVTLSALGFAIPILIDSIMLVRKDLNKQLGKEININIELFEKEVISQNSQKKIISGIRVTLSI